MMATYLSHGPSSHNTLTIDETKYRKHTNNGISITTIATTTIIIITIIIIFSQLSSWQSSSWQSSSSSRLGIIIVIENKFYCRSRFLFKLERGIRAVGSQKFLRIVIVASRIFTAWLWRSEAILKTPMAPLRCSSLSLHILKRSASHPWLASCVKLIDLASLLTQKNVSEMDAKSNHHWLTGGQFITPSNPATASKSPNQPRTQGLLARFNATSVNFLAASPRHALSWRSFWRPSDSARGF